MRSYEVGLIIDADVADVWAALIDVGAEPIWDCGVELEMRMAEAVPRERLVWRGGMRWGSFTRTRTFDLAHLRDRARLTVIEAYSGPLTPFVCRSMPDVQPVLEELVQGLKLRVEG
jgi:hypothetical protein